MSALRRAGLEFVGVESHERVGGIWDIANPISSIYEGMCTVTSRTTTYLTESMPDDWPDYVPHEKALEHFQRVANTTGILPKIRFRTAFEDARKSDDGTWMATLRDVGQDRRFEESFRAIVFATGAHNQQRASIPVTLREQAEKSGIQVIHSSQYKHPTDFAGKRVLVVGIGNSGSDIADKISAHAERTMIAVRTPPWINPQYMFGSPIDKLAAEASPLLPEWYKQGAFHVVRRLAVGSFRRLGLRQPKHGLNDRLPIGDRGIVQAIRSGRVQIRSNVTGFENGCACFENSDHPDEPVDVALFATGFSRQYPLLSHSGASADEVAESLLFFVFHRSEPGLTYLAETIGLRGCWPVFAEQAEAIAAYYRAEQQGAANVQAFNARRSLPTPDFKGHLFRRADRFHVGYNNYEQALRELSTWLSE